MPKNDGNPCNVKKNNKSHRGETYNVIFQNLTKGEVMAMRHAFEMYAEHSPVCEDLRAYLSNALERENLDIK